MRSKSVSILCIVLTLCFSVFLLACSNGGGGGDETVYITVTFEPNGGIGDKYTQQIELGATAALSDNLFTHEELHFNGWNTAADGSGTAFADNASFLAVVNTTLYAQWSQGEPEPEPEPELGYVFVLFRANLGSGTMENQRIAENSSDTLTANEFTRAGYSFVGWNTAANGSGESYVNGATVHVTTVNVTLYAQWSANSYTLTFNANTGVGEQQTATVKFDQTVALKGDIFTKDDFRFSGWNTAANGSGNGYAASADYTHNVDGNVTFYAQWVALTAPDSPMVVDAGGMFESAYVEFGKVSGAKSYAVYSKPANGSEFVKIDDELIRDYSSYMRADILGLKAGEHSIKVVAVSEADIESAPIYVNSVFVMSYVREGFAFAENSPNKSASGAYNDDGTLKNGAKIIYVTEQNKNTVSMDIVVDVGKNKTETGVGLAGIFKLREKSTGETTPLVVRIIGEVVKPNDVDSNELINVKKTSNVTWEGVGEDALMRAWGINVREAINVEIRNLAFTGFKDDSVSVQSNNRNVWIHNNDFMIGADMGGDKNKGDGSSDIKQDSSFVTINYNHYIETGKSALVGQGDSGEFFVTMSNNYFDRSGSRHPRVRFGSVHVFNNYFKGVTVYGIGAAKFSNIFVEGNYFENTHRPMIISGQGRDIGSDGKGTLSGEEPGAIKEQNNFFDAKSLSTYTKGVDSGLDNNNSKGAHKYNHFDDNFAANGYPYTLKTPENAKDDVLMYAGRMKKYTQDDGILLEQFIAAVMDRYG